MDDKTRADEWSKVYREVITACLPPICEAAARIADQVVKEPQTNDD